MLLLAMCCCMGMSPRMTGEHTRRSTRRLSPLGFQPIHACSVAGCVFGSTFSPHRSTFHPPALSAKTPSTPGRRAFLVMRMNSLPPQRSDQCLEQWTTLDS
ncbi:hypothetical protein BDV26DRAFT_64265 [Aspergillus bertholletiae]|uniref:Secreted protein n=1 Tax=Aspergillus bertholletiae TaxID=1226010 RepID=A0A5N7BIX4_9EURO|nr:hypothetical protein BDV26DRAFT_64265 [Aspergillus bertholletiae]